MGFNVDEYYNLAEETDVLIAYKGDISSEIISDSLEVIEARLADDEENPKHIKKLYNVLVECLQNLFHHCDKVDVNGMSELYDKYGVFSVSKKGIYYKVTTGNIVNKEKIHVLKDRIEQLNSLNAEEIKVLYKIVLNNEEFSDKGGGGLGLIDIIKRTESKIDYSFKQIDDNFYFYIFNVNV